MYSLKRKNDFDNWFDWADEMFPRGLMPEVKREFSIGIPANVKEVENGYDVELSLPGYDKADIKAEMLDSKHLSVQIDRKKEEINEKEHREFYRHEHLSRIIPLSKEVDASGIKAEYKDGILKLNLPFNAKVEETKKIEIK